jgi:hypothetical protein
MNQSPAGHRDGKHAHRDGGPVGKSMVDAYIMRTGQCQKIMHEIAASMPDNSIEVYLINEDGREALI